MANQHSSHEHTTPLPRQGANDRGVLYYRIENQIRIPAQDATHFYLTCKEYFVCQF